MFSFLKRKRLQELETISENKATEKAAKELGLKITYQETKEHHLLPPEHFKIIIIDFKNVPHETKIKFEELQQEYQQQEYQKMLRHIGKKILISLSILGGLVSAITVSTCTQSSPTTEHTPHLIQKAKPPVSESKTNTRSE